MQPRRAWHIGTSYIGGGGMVAAREFSAQAILNLLKSGSAWELIEQESRRWLDEMMEDSKHEKAPQELRDGAAAVRRYLGVSLDGTIMQSQHRKFAARFDRYLLENTAPNK